MRRSSFTAAVLIAAGSVTLAGCSQFEPFQRPGTWHENDAPMHNIAAELAYPSALYRGSSDPVLTGEVAETAIGGALSPSSGRSSSSAAPAGGASGGGSSGTGGVGGASSGGGGVGGGMSGGSMP